jgi:hypothetical protein
MIMAGGKGKTKVQEEESPAVPMSAQKERAKSKG